MNSAQSPSAFDASLLSASASDALAALVSAGTSAEKLVDAWVKQGNAAAVAEAAERGEGAARKAARRGLNVLKARGVAIPERARVAALSGGKEAEQVEAQLFSPDSSGTVLLVLTAKSATSRVKAGFFFLHDDAGVLRLNVGEMSQSGLRDAIAKTVPAAGARSCKVPLEWARQRIQAARQKNVERKNPEPLGFQSAEGLLGASPLAAAAPAPHPFDGEGLELSDEDARESVKSSAALHQLPEFQAWFPDKASVDEMMLEVGKALAASGLEPTQEPPPELMRETLDQQIIAATDRYFTPERRAVLVRALKDAALSVLSREGEAKALEVAALMKVVPECGLITNPPHEVPFLRGYFEKAVMLLSMQGQGKIRIPVPPPA